MNWMEEEGKAPNAITGTIKAVKSWLNHNHIEIRRKIRVRNADSTAPENERVPEGKELAELFNRADLRTGAVMALVAKAGKAGSHGKA
ncbi:MAG: hypothetical protein QXP61_09240 [Nitrososphaerales archaeon]